MRIKSQLCVQPEGHLLLVEKYSYFLQSPVDHEKARAWVEYRAGAAGAIE